jgi:hypothetical protein
VRVGMRMVVGVVVRMGMPRLGLVIRFAATALLAHD